MPGVPAHENPYRAAVLDALPFLPQGVTWEALWRRVAMSLPHGTERRCPARWAIVGPHGSGKTTLLERLGERLTAEGWECRTLFRQREGGPGIPVHWREDLAAWRAMDAPAGARTIMLVDGYGHLWPGARWSVRQATRNAAGLIVTAHRSCGLPVLLRTTTSPALLAELVRRIDPDREPSSAEIERLYQSHRGNLRDALRELYDRAGET